MRRRSRSISFPSAFPSQRGGRTEPSSASKQIKRARGAPLFYSVPSANAPPHLVRSSVGGNSMLRRGAAAAAAALLLLVLLLAAAAEAEGGAAALPMELYFSPAELARVAGYGEEPVSSVSVSGQVACELCPRTGSDRLAFDIPGAKVAVFCKTEGPNQVASSAFAATDEYGNFTIDLPSQLHATPNLHKSCAVKLLELPVDSSCRLRHRPGTSYGLRLLSVEDGVRAYTTGVIRLQNSETPSDKCVSVDNRTERR